MGSEEIEKRLDFSDRLDSSEEATSRATPDTDGLGRRMEADVVVVDPVVEFSFNTTRVQTNTQSVHEKRDGCVVVSHVTDEASYDVRKSATREVLSHCVKRSV